MLSGAESTEGSNRVKKMASGAASTEGSNRVKKMASGAASTEGSFVPSSICCNEERLSVRTLIVKLINKKLIIEGAKPTIYMSSKNNTINFQRLKCDYIGKRND